MNRTKRNLALFYIIYFLQGLCFYGPVATLYRRSAGLTLFDIAIIESSSVAVMLLLEIPWGYVADRLGHRRTIILCLFLLAASKVVFWRAETFGGFLFERLILALAVSGLSRCDSAYLYACVGEEEAQKAYGRWNGIMTAGLLVVGVVSSLFLREDYRLAALLTVGTYTLSALLALGLAEPGESGTTREKPRIREALRGSMKLVPFLLGAGLLAETAQFVTVFLNQVQYQRAGIPIRWFGLLYSAVTLVSLLGARSHRLTGRLGMRRGGGLLFLAAGAACMWMALFPSPALSVAGVMALKLAAALFLPLSMAEQNRRAAERGVGAATQLSCNAMVLDLVSLGINPAFGHAADLGAEKALFLGAAACAAGAGLFLWGTRAERAEGL
ncbi:MAG: MFS transporter [Clostridia bacterium]|nr:MFS transporter [Clostridia bacterium]